MRAAHKPRWDICLDRCCSALDAQDDQRVLLHRGTGAPGHLTPHVLPISCIKSQGLSPQGVQKYWAGAGGRGLP